MNDLEQMWNEEGGVFAPTPRVSLNAPETGVMSPLEKDGLPFVAHAQSFAPHLSHDLKTRALHEAKMEELTQVWGPSSPNTIDIVALQQATKHLLEGAFSGDFNKVKDALQMGADSNTLVWVKNTQQETPHYDLAPLGAAVAMLGQRQKMLKHIPNTQSFDEVARVLLMDGPQSKVQVGVSDDNTPVLGYTVSNMYVGDQAQYRHMPLSMSQQVAVCRAAPEAMIDGKMNPQTDGVAMGEELPRFLRDTYADLYDPKRDSLQEALQDFRTRRANPSSSHKNKMSL